MRNRIGTLTLGCKVNTYDTEAMLELFIEKGYEIVDFSETADIYLINTCTVTNLSDKKSRQMIRRARKQNPESIVVATGCYAQVSPEDVSKIEGINLVVGTKDRNKIIEIIEDFKKNRKNNKDNKVVSVVTDIMKEHDFEKLSVKGLANKTRAYLKIQEGCTQFCSYCIIPYARGPLRSRDPKDVLEEVNILAKNSFKEIVLAGIHIASYGKDLGNTDLLKVLSDVCKVDGIERIRFSSIEPCIITQEFVNTIKSLNKICHHMHLSLQSGCDKTLKRMNRKYTTKEYREAVYLLREAFPEISITTDIIVGFPGETEEDFMESYSFCKEMRLSKIHVFPFSPKKGTKACEFNDQISKNVKEERSSKFISLANSMQKEFIKSFIGKNGIVLFEKKSDDNMYEGHTSNYITVKVNSETDIVNKILKINFIDSIDFTLLGTVE